MPRVSLTDAQRLQHCMDDLCKEVIQSIEYTFVVKNQMNKRETAAALGLHPNTWSSWRTNKLDGGVGFRDVVEALHKAGYQIRVEAKT